MIHKVITVKQPWARLIAQGIKNIENRTWKTNYRGRVLIHASSIPVKMINPNNVFTKEQWNSLSDGIQKEIICGKDYVNSAIIGSIEIVDCVQNHPSVWAEKGVYNWVLANPILFDKPIEGVKGKVELLGVRTTGRTEARADLHPQAHGYEPCRAFAQLWPEKFKRLLLRRKRPGNIRCRMPEIHRRMSSQRLEGNTYVQ